NTFGQDQDDIVMVPLSTARQKLFGRLQGKVRAVWGIIGKIREGEDLDDAEAQIRELLRQRHGLQPYQDDDFTLRNPSEVLQAQEAASRVMAYLLAAIGSVSLLVGGIGIMNIMLVSVTERTREIGLRMAVGARSRDILTQFLVEAVTLSLIGGAIGIAVGLGGASAISYFAEWRTLIEAELIVVACGVAAARGLLFGLCRPPRPTRPPPAPSPASPPPAAPPASIPWKPYATSRHDERGASCTLPMQLQVGGRLADESGEQQVSRRPSPTQHA